MRKIYFLSGETDGGVSEVGSYWTEFDAAKFAEKRPNNIYFFGPDLEERVFIYASEYQPVGSTQASSLLAEVEENVDTVAGIAPLYPQFIYFTQEINTEDPVEMIMGFG